MLGEGIIKGMAVTAKNFLGSYVSEERLTTIQYPEERQALPEADLLRQIDLYRALLRGFTYSDRVTITDMPGTEIIAA